MMTRLSSFSTEVEKFSRLAKRWWDQHGPFGPLHRMNPVRVGFIRDKLSQHFQASQSIPSSSLPHLPLKGLNVLDVGCGGGLLSEPLARLGAKVLGIDASLEGIEVARAHAKKDPIVEKNVSYQQCNSEDLFWENRSSSELFDAVIASEIIEHVEYPKDFLRNCANLVKPGGALFVSTINRTPKSYALAIVGAEYIFRFVPAGTHDWNNFLSPKEISEFLNHNITSEISSASQVASWPFFGKLSTDLVSRKERSNVTNVFNEQAREQNVNLIRRVAASEFCGLIYQPFPLSWTSDWRLDWNDLSVNYIAYFHLENELST